MKWKQEEETDSEWEEEVHLDLVTLIEDDKWQTIPFVFKLPEDPKSFFDEYGYENGTLALKRAREYNSWLAN